MRLLEESCEFGGASLRLAHEVWREGGGWGGRGGDEAGELGGTSGGGVGGCGQGPLGRWWSGSHGLPARLSRWERDDDLISCSSLPLPLSLALLLPTPRWAGQRPVRRASATSRHVPRLHAHPTSPTKGTRLHRLTLLLVRLAAALSSAQRQQPPQHGRRHTLPVLPQHRPIPPHQLLLPPRLDLALALASARERAPAAPAANLARALCRRAPCRPGVPLGVVQAPKLVAAPSSTRRAGRAGQAASHAPCARASRIRLRGQIVSIARPRARPPGRVLAGRPQAQAVRAPVRLLQAVPPRRARRACVVVDLLRGVHRLCHERRAAAPVERPAGTPPRRRRLAGHPARHPLARARRRGVPAQGAAQPLEGCRARRARSHGQARRHARRHALDLGRRLARARARRRHDPHGAPRRLHDQCVSIPFSASPSPRLGRASTQS